MTKAEIRTAFLSILNNTDCTNALADQFVFDQGIARSQRLLRLRSQETLEATVVGSSFTSITIPSDSLRIIGLYHEQFLAKRIGLAEYVSKSYGAGTSNTPCYWTQNRGTILITPTPNEGVTMNLLYYAAFEDFASDDDDTPLSIKAPDLFIYGGLVFAADHYIDERLPRFEQRYNQIISELQAEADDDELSGGAVISNAYEYPCEDY